MLRINNKKRNETKIKNVSPLIWICNGIPQTYYWENDFSNNYQLSSFRIRIQQTKSTLKRERTLTQIYIHPSVSPKAQSLVYTLTYRRRRIAISIHPKNNQIKEFLSGLKRKRDSKANNALSCRVTNSLCLAKKIV